MPFNFYFMIEELKELFRIKELFLRLITKKSKDIYALIEIELNSKINDITRVKLDENITIPLQVLTSRETHIKASISDILPDTSVIYENLLKLSKERWNRNEELGLCQNKNTITGLYESKDCEICRYYGICNVFGKLEDNSIVIQETVLNQIIKSDNFKWFLVKYENIRGEKNNQFMRILNELLKSMVLEFVLKVSEYLSKNNYYRCDLDSAKKFIKSLKF